MTKTTETTIEADPKLPIIRMTRDFAATQSLVDSFEGRDAWLASGETGVNDGYAKLERMLADGAV
jgi:hypothetical protein